MVYMYHSFSIHSSADGHLGCFHVLAMINSAAMNIGCTCLFQVWFPGCVCPAVGLLGHTAFARERLGAPGAAPGLGRTSHSPHEASWGPTLHRPRGREGAGRSSSASPPFHSLFLNGVGSDLSSPVLSPSISCAHFTL